MEPVKNDNDVKNLCSRKLLDLLKNNEWQSTRHRIAIESELLQRRHYLEQVAQLAGNKRLVTPSTATRH